jgi:hypothetical protein
MAASDQAVGFDRTPIAKASRIAAAAAAKIRRAARKLLECSVSGPPLNLLTRYGVSDDVNAERPTGVWV